MVLFYCSILLTILANIFYHIFQKSIDANVNPIVSLITTYITAIVFSFVILLFFPDKVDFIDSVKRLNWASFALGGAIVGLEMGFLLAYRAGWNISLAAMVSNVSVAIVLVPIGMLFFKENVTATSILGVAFCITGLILIK